MRVVVELTEAEATTIDSGRGLLTYEAFVRKSAIEKATLLIRSTTQEERRGAVPLFAHERPRQDSNLRPGD